MRIITLITYILLLTSCSSSDDFSIKKITLKDRTGRATYSVTLPDGWTYKEGLPTTDTTQPNGILVASDGLELTFYTFPQEQRISPEAQVARWQQQTTEEPVITPLSFGGYRGLLFETSETVGVALSLPQLHLNVLTDPQKKADITLKATGTKESILRNSDEIIALTHSFGLIEEIPGP